MNHDEFEPDKKPSLALNLLCFAIPFAAILAPILLLNLDVNEKNPLSKLVGLLLDPRALVAQGFCVVMTPLVVLARAQSSLRTKSAAKSVVAGCGCNMLGLVAAAIFIATTFKGCC